MFHQPTTEASPRDPSRRRVIGLLAGGLTALAAGACAPARILLQDYPEEYRSDTEATEVALRAFVETVVPGTTGGELGAVGVLRDRFYPLAPYAAFLASDLDRRARRGYRTRFDRLSPGERSAILADGLASRDKTTRKLYGGAAFLAQVAVYGGVYDDRAGCALIDFPGGYKIIPRTAVPPSFRARYAPAALTHDGNPA